MTRRDYIDLAAALLKARPSSPITIAERCGIHGWRQAVEAVADVCARDPVFDRARFLKNAGVKT